MSLQNEAINVLFRLKANRIYYLSISRPYSILTFL
jgi:hypothetical protein